jgi:hypothetical protein
VNDVTPSPRLILAAWCGAAVLGLAGCGGDDEPSGDGSAAPTPSTSVSTSEAAPSDTPGTSTPSTPTVAPAIGIELREKISSIHAPEGWIPVDPLVSYQSAAMGPNGSGTIDLIDDKTLNPGTSLEVRVDSAIKTLPKGADYVRLDDVILGDSTAYHLSYTVKGNTEVNDVVETERNGRLITINFSLDQKTVRGNPDLVASVLATFQWIA